jgi:gliding motility-associated-like protein
MFPNILFNEYLVTLIATSEYGCIDSTTISIQITDELIFYVPNAFTPDGDNHNNTFKPVFSSGFDPYDYTLLIFNRWGEIVFESRNAQVGWDGTYAGIPCHDGVYVWKVIVGLSNNANRAEKIGHVTLLR